MSDFSESSQLTINIDLGKFLEKNNESGDTDRASVHYITRSIYLAFSLIMKRRRIFPPEAFKKIILKPGLSIYTLNSKLDICFKMLNIFKSLKRAIQLKYIEEFVLVLGVSSNPAKASEVFRFQIHYDEDNNVSTEKEDDNLSTKANAEDSNKNELKNLLIYLNAVCKENLKKLPEKLTVSFQVKYSIYAPSDYKLPNFEDCGDYLLNDIAHAIECSNYELSYFSTSIPYISQVL